MPDAPSTPLLEQYAAVRAQYPGHLVLFRVGDFYETFGDDAALLARELDITLTARSPDASGHRTPMAGVPYHAVDAYLGRLVRKGYKVALCDQVEDARFAKGLVKRMVTRVVTPGTVVEDRLLGGPDHSYLAVVVDGGTAPGEYACVDVTTGDWFHGNAPAAGLEPLASALAPFRPREILWSAGEEARARQLVELLTREYPTARIEASPPPLEAVATGPEDGRPAGPITGATDADRRLIAYVAATQPRLVRHLAPPRESRPIERLRLDAKTLRHLEIVRPMNPDDPSGPTLLDTWDETVTSAGRRTLSFWLANPLVDPAAIDARLDAVDDWRSHPSELAELRRSLAGVGDLARIATRIAGRRATVREVFQLRDSLRQLQDRVAVVRSEPAPSGLNRELLAGVRPPADLLATLANALPDGLDETGTDAPTFRAGFSAELDAALEHERTALADLAALERREQLRTGIKTLKIGYNQVFGYYFDVSRPNLAKVPADYRRKQTLAQGERFTSDELAGLEARLLAARDEALQARERLWERFLTTLESDVPTLYRLGRTVGELDAISTFAHLALTRGYVRPVIDRSVQLSVRDGRHPVLDRALRERFVPNDTDLDGAGERLLVLTGPNMSGKSTYMRQVGLLTVLAQAGSFVPARYARIGVVTSLYTRMGFTDEIGRGKSSFMVEMSEVADILRQADAGSLVLLDEVGRGTSTFDGLALAWATIRHLAEETRCRTIVATHYHQLTQLIEQLDGARNAHLAAQDRRGEIVFLHRLVPGSTDRSYGLHVARLAGVPSDVIEEARRLLARLESDGIPLAAPRRGRTGPTRYTQAILLGSDDRREPPWLRELAALDPATLDPAEALKLIRRWRALEPGRPPEAP